MQGVRPSITRVLASAVLLAVFVSTHASAQDLPQTFTAKDFEYKALYKEHKRKDIALRAFEEVEDDDTRDGKALVVKLDKQLTREGDLPILETPAIGQLPVGTYRVTVRMKVQGLLSSLGSAIAIKAGNQTREVWLTHCKREDQHEEFSVDFDVREGDLITRRDSGYKFKADRGPGNMVLKEQYPTVAEAAKKNAAPWEDRIVWEMRQRYGETKVKGDVDDTLAAPVEATAREHIGKAIPVPPEPEEGSRKPSLSPRGVPRSVIIQMNRQGATPSDGSVLLYFPHNNTQAGGKTRGPATPLPTLRNVSIDFVHVEKLPEPDHLVMREVTLVKPWLRRGETQTFRVWLHNRSGKQQTGTVRVVVHSGFDQKTTAIEQSVSLPTGSYENLSLDWTVPDTFPEWGQTAVAQVVVNGKVVSEERAWFAVHKYVNAVQIGGPPNTRRWLHPYARPSNSWTQSEMGPAQGTTWDSAGVVPDDDVFWDAYASGAGGMWWSVGSWAAWAQEMRDKGVAPYFYLAPSGSAQRAFEIYWDHPDWVPGIPANSDIFFIRREETVAKYEAYLRGEYKPARNENMGIARAGGAYSGELLTLNGIVKENVDRVIEGIIKLLEVAPMEGVRWDGIPFRAFNSKSLGGNWGKTPEEIDAIGVANIARAKKEIREKFPHFEVAWNGGVAELEEKPEDPFDFDKAWEILQDRDPLQVELLHDHGNVMEEMWMKYGSFGAYTNSCLGYLRASRFENHAMKMAGGHNNHMLWYYDFKTQWTPDEIYQQLFTILGGAHVTSSMGPIPDTRHDLGVWALRFSEWIWDPQLRPIPNLIDRVEYDAERELWVTETGFQKINERGNLVWIIAIINPPVTELWHQNRFGLLPEPTTEPTGLTIYPPDDVEGVANIYLLDNDPDPRIRELKFEDDGDEVYVEVPPLKLFKVIAIEFEK